MVSGAQRDEGGTLIKIENITKAFGGIHAVNDCSFQINEGTITGLIGPNGAGKSTLFNIVAGFIRPDSGHISLNGQDVTGTLPHRLFHRGLVRTFQTPQQFSRMTVRENLMLVPAEQSGENLFNAWLRWGTVKKQESALIDQVEDVLSFLNLDHVATELAGNISGGQKKLLELGRTMMTDAKVVLLDEPGAGVNRTLLGTLEKAIERLNRERGYTFCLIEHDMDLVARLCDPVVVMGSGRVITQGSFDSVRNNPQVIEAYLGGEAA